MERNSQNNQGYKLESQIREAYGRIVYTQTCHDKFLNRVLEVNTRIKTWQIILSAVTTSGFVITIFSDDKIASILGTVISLALLILNTYVKNFNLIESAKNIKLHQIYYGK